MNKNFLRKKRNIIYKNEVWQYCVQIAKIPPSRNFKYEIYLDHRAFFFATLNI